MNPLIILNHSKQKLAKLMKTEMFSNMNSSQNRVSNYSQMPFLDSCRNARTLLRQFNWWISCFLKAKQTLVSTQYWKHYLFHSMDSILSAFLVLRRQYCSYTQFRFRIRFWNSVDEKYLEAVATVGNVVLKLSALINMILAWWKKRNSPEKDMASLYIIFCHWTNQNSLNTRRN